MQPLTTSSPHPGFPGEALAGQGAGIEGGGPLYDHAVDRHLFPRLDDNDAAGLDLVGVYLLELPVRLDVGVVGPDVHQLADVAAAFADGIGLEPLAHLVEEHDGDRLGIVPASLVDGQQDGAYRRHRHQEVLVEDLAVFNPLERLPEDVVADRQVGDHVEGKPQDPFRRDKGQHCHHRRRGKDADEHLFLLFIHRGCLQ